MPAGAYARPMPLRAATAIAVLVTGLAVVAGTSAAGPAGAADVGRRLLRDQGRVRLALRITFVPAGGSPSTQRTSARAGRPG